MGRAEAAPPARLRSSMTASSLIPRPLLRWTTALCAAVLVAVAGTVAVAAPAAAATCRAADHRPTRAKDLPAANAAVACLVNRERTKRGLKALKANATLAKVELALARDMVRRHYFDHTSPGGRTFADRLKAAHWRGSAAGENIAWGSGDLGSPARIVTGWMHSAGHRANILNKAFTRAGTAVVIGAPEADVDDGTTFAMAYDRP
jgi:uncharacterized protein YkwD